MNKEIIKINADSKEKAETLARGVYAVCPDAEIQLFYPQIWKPFVRSAREGHAGMAGSGPVAAPEQEV